MESLVLWTGCFGVRGLLSEYADGALEDHEKRRVEQHLSHCSACQQELSQLRARLAELATVGLDDLLRVRLELERELSFGARAGRWLASLVLLISCGVLATYSHELLTRAPSTTMKGSGVSLKGQLPAVVRRHLIASAPIAAVTVAKPEISEMAPIVSETQVTKAPAVVAKAEPKPAPKPEKVVLAWLDLRPRLYVIAQPAAAKPKPKTKAPVVLKAPPTKIRDQLARLGLGPGYRYGELLFFPILDRTEKDRSSGARTGRLPTVSVNETEPPRPSRLLVKTFGRRRAWPLLPGLLIEAPWGWRILRAGMELKGAEAHELAVISVADPDVLFLQTMTRGYRPRFKRRLLTAPAMAPRAVRVRLALDGDNGSARRALWSSFLDAQDFESERESSLFVPADSLKSQKLAKTLRLRMLAIDTEIHELVRRLQRLFALEKGFRGLAMSLGEKPYSLDFFDDAASAQGAVESLVLGLALEAFEASLYTPLIGSNRALLKGRVETLDIHRLLLRLLREVRGKPGQAYRHISKKARLEAVFRVELGAKGTLRHGFILKTAAGR